MINDTASLIADLHVKQNGKTVYDSNNLYRVTNIKNLLTMSKVYCWFSFAPVVQWCCSTPQGSPGVGRNTLFLSNPHLCFIIVFICDLFVSRDDPLMS